MSITVDMNKLNLNPASRGDSEVSSSSDEDEEKGNISTYLSLVASPIDRKYLRSWT
jgi:hypothetical protein